MGRRLPARWANRGLCSHHSVTNSIRYIALAPGPRPAVALPAPLARPALAVASLLRRRHHCERPSRKCQDAVVANRAGRNGPHRPLRHRYRPRRRPSSQQRSRAVHAGIYPRVDALNEHRQRLLVRVPCSGGCRMARLRQMALWAVFTPHPAHIITALSGSWLVNGQGRFIER